MKMIQRRHNTRIRKPITLLRLVPLVVCALAVLWLGYRFFVLQPSNNRDWAYGMEVLPHIMIDGNVVTVQHERDYRWSADGPVSADYVDRSFDVDRLERVWFVEEPFPVAPFNDFEGMAHTYFVFDFQGQPPVAISVEARRQRGQAYEVVRGTFNEYELMYVWSTEQDGTGRRAVLENRQLYMYPIVGSMDSARTLFLGLAAESAQLETHPRFYNSLISNCTNELAKAANEAQPGAIPPTIALILPGYADRVLYDLGFIPTDAPFETIRARYAITEMVKQTLDQPDFSRLLRSHLDSADPVATGTG
jgi:hypothetical protein